MGLAARREDDLRKLAQEVAALGGEASIHPLDVTDAAALASAAEAYISRFGVPDIVIANAGQAAPVIGLVVLLAMAMGFGTATAVVALSIYAFLPVLQNTITGLQGVDQRADQLLRLVGGQRSIGSGLAARGPDGVVDPGVHVRSSCRLRP